MKTFGIWYNTQQIFGFITIFNHILNPTSLARVLEGLPMYKMSYSSTVIAPVGHEVTHAMQSMQSPALTGMDFLESG
jgi:hypothetical protein